MFFKKINLWFRKFILKKILPSSNPIYSDINEESIERAFNEINKINTRKESLKEFIDRKNVVK